MTTTTSLCTDLSRLAADNPEHQRTVWRTDHDPLFLFIDAPDTTKERISLRDNVFTSGLIPKHASGSMKFPGPGNDSAFILSWYDPERAFGYYLESSSPDNGMVFIIDAPGGIDRDTTTENEPSHHGVLFPGGIRGEFIKGVFTTVSTETGSKTVFDANPHYHGGGIPDGYFDLVVTPWSPSNAAVFPDSKINVTPAGITVGNITRRYKKGTEIHLTLDCGADEYWYINGNRQSVNGHSFTLSVDAQVSPVIVIYPGKA